MSEHPSIPLMLFPFLLENRTLLKQLIQSNSNQIDNQIKNTLPLKQAIIPRIEKFTGPMQEGMFYIMFSSTGSSDVTDIDSILRYFWVSSHQLQYHQLDGYLISHKNPDQHWTRYYPQQLLQGHEKGYWPPKIQTKEARIHMTGEWQKGYHLELTDVPFQISGTLDFKPIHPEAILTYYNNHELVTPSLMQHFYDGFGIQVTGKLQLDKKEIQLENARGIIEHGVGLFSTLHFQEWTWVNLQTNNESIHFFSHPIIDDIGQKHQAGEGAAIIGGEWRHIISKDFQIKPTMVRHDEINNLDIPVEWTIKGSTSNTLGEDFRLTLSAEAYYVWYAGITGFGRYYVNYLLSFHGKWGTHPLNGKGTLEYMFPFKSGKKTLNLKENKFK